VGWKDGSAVGPSDGCTEGLDAGAVVGVEGEEVGEHEYSSAQHLKLAEDPSLSGLRHVSTLSSSVLALYAATA
jgi:hypothetical protein